MNPDWNELHHNFDLSEPDIPGTCVASNDESCCRCFKKKTCMDTGCKDEFGGSGICINVKESMENFGIDWEAGHDPKPNLCENTLMKDCCSCFKLNDKNTCKNDKCKEKGGKCVMPHMIDMSTKLVEEGWNWEYYCDEELDCKCYVPEGNGNNGCENDQCTENGGKCIMPGGQAPQGWQDVGFCNETIGCKCYMSNEADECKNDQCAENGGSCIMPGEQAPQGWETKGICDEEMQCKCYAPKEECKNAQCTNTKKGTCIMPNENPPANHVAKGFCNQEMGCKCYVPQSDPEPQDCKSEKCKKIFGLCIEKGQSVASNLASLYQPATGNAAFCHKASECKCYKPKCKDTNKCKQAKGKCFSNKIAPSGWTLVKKKGKNIVCKKSLKCYCYKQNDGKSERSLDNNDLDVNEDDLEDGPDDYLESEKDFDDDF